MQVTVGRLLNHTAGLPDYGDLPEYAAVRGHPGHPWSREDFLTILRGRGLVRAPGEGWAYSNLGYLCLRMVLEGIHGGPLSRVHRSELFDPVEVGQHYHPGWVAHGLVLSTAGELALLLDALLAGPLLAAGTVAAMTEPVVLPSAVTVAAAVATETPDSGLALALETAGRLRSGNPQR